MTDTTRFDMVGCYGFPQMHTPNVDALAEKYSNMGGYVYCYGNPINLVDPDGKK